MKTEVRVMVVGIMCGCENVEREVSISMVYHVLRTIVAFAWIVFIGI